MVFFYKCKKEKKRKSILSKKNKVSLASVSKRLMILLGGSQKYRYAASLSIPWFAR